MRFEIINLLKKEKGLTNLQLARLSGVTLSTLDKITAGINTNPKLDTMQAICRALGCRLDDFDDLPKTKNTPDVSPKAKSVARRYQNLDAHGREMVELVIEAEIRRMETPEESESNDDTISYINLYRYLTPVSAGTGVDLYGDIPTDDIRVADNLYTRKAQFVLETKGSSMDPQFSDGDLLLVQETKELEIGEIGIFTINDMGYVKKYAGDKLVSINPRYEAIYFDENDTIRCVGRVVGKLDPSWIS